MIARFMSFCKPGVTEWYQSHIDCRTKAKIELVEFKPSSLSALSAETILLLYSLKFQDFYSSVLISLYKIVSVDSGLE